MHTFLKKRENKKKVKRQTNTYNTKQLKKNDKTKASIVRVVKFKPMSTLET